MRRTSFWPTALLGGAWLLSSCESGSTVPAPVDAPASTAADAPSGPGTPDAPAGPILVPGFALDDTGVTTCSTATTDGLACSSPAAGTDLFPRQDGDRGRDVAARDEADGHAGFSFVKLDAAGAALPDQSVAYATTPWACVADRTTGLTWEVRTTDGGLRDRRWRYTFYRTSGLRPGFVNGSPNGGACVDRSSCDTERYVAAVNAAGLCGHTDWRLPARAELLSLVDYGAPASAPLVDANFLPDGEADMWWSGTADWLGLAWTVSFATGASQSMQSRLALPVRLVRGGF
jgi:hypothetical protein